MGLEECLEDIGQRMDDIEERKWYDIEVLKALHTWIGDEKGERYMRRGGNYTVRDLGVLSYLVKFTNVKRLLKKAPKSYQEAFNFGSVHIDVKEGGAVIKMKGVKVDEYACLAWRGVFEGTLDATDTDGLVEAFEDDTKEEDDCYFKMQWD